MSDRPHWTKPLLTMEYLLKASCATELYAMSHQGIASGPLNYYYYVLTTNY